MPRVLDIFTLKTQTVAGQEERSSDTIAMELPGRIVKVRSLRHFISVTKLPVELQPLASQLEIDNKRPQLISCHIKGTTPAADGSHLRHYLAPAQINVSRDPRPKAPVVHPI